MIRAALSMKCPKCHKGDMFVNKNPFKLSTVSVMHPHCTCCGQSFEPEPGFYFGAMYVSYGLGVVYFLAGFLVLYYLIDLPGWLFLTIYTVTMVLLWPVIFRNSRVIYLYLFVRYDKNAC